jgi:hypothetical protein
VNLAPRPIPSLAASIVPPCCSTRFFTIARPSPGPVAGEISPCRNGSNTCGRKSGWMPDSRVLDQLAERLRVPVDRRPRLRDTGGAHDLRTSEHAQPTTRQWRSAACAIRATRWRGTAGRDDDAVFGMNADRRDEERHGPRRKIGSPRGDAGFVEPRCDIRSNEVPEGLVAGATRADAVTRCAGPKTLPRHRRYVARNTFREKKSPPSRLAVEPERLRDDLPEFPRLRGLPHHA